jgi:mannose-1-phosphate guanylyltransferase
MSGEGRVVLDGEVKNVSAGDTVTMKAGMKHTVIAVTELGIIEVQLGKDINVEDKVKYPFPEV